MFIFPHSRNKFIDSNEFATTMNKNLTKLAQGMLLTMFTKKALSTKLSGFSENQARTFRAMKSCFKKLCFDLYRFSYDKAPCFGTRIWKPLVYLSLFLRSRI